jgi:dTDP-4-amino-4,6-dideoxygalactose transaminase
MEVTNTLSERLIRLPLWAGITEAQQAKVSKVLTNAVQVA